MKRPFFLIASFAAVVILSCSEPMNITSNPDDHTTTSGTINSGRMTNELPRKSDNMKIPDTIAPTRDTLRRNQ